MKAKGGDIIGGKPSKGTKKDMRLSKNKPKPAQPKHMKGKSGY